MSEIPGYQRILAELKRRKVFRLAAFYGTAGFVAVQAADVFVPALGLPPSILRVVAFLVIAGFPLALLVAWIYERTPQGLKRTGDASEDESDAIVSEVPSRRWPLWRLCGAGCDLYRKDRGPCRDTASRFLRERGSQAD